MEKVTSAIVVSNKDDNMNVLSLFDGMSCGRIALDRVGVKVWNYYASEIDKYATKVSEANYPDIIRLGDVALWREWNIDWASIDLVTGGFPCQAWSMAGKQLGDKDERGMLFWVMLDIISHVKKSNPKADFLIENVKMKNEFEQYITEHTEKALGEVHKILINSALLSAQNRNRYYWTSFEVSQPEDKVVVLSDIVEHGVVDREKTHCIDANYYKGGNLKSHFEKHRRQLVFEAKNGKAVIINHEDIRQPRTFYEARTEFGKSERKRLSALHGRDTSPRDKKCKHYVAQPHNKANCIVTVDSFLNWIIDPDFYCRKLTPIECERLQTVPDNYTAMVSNTQRYKMLGNGWTVDVIAHILKGMK